jgi:hypothetical protein
MTLPKRVSHDPIIIIVLALALRATSAGAADPDAPTFLFSGFGTAGIVHSSEDKADFTSTFVKPNGAGHSRKWSADVDSLLAAQITANPVPKVAAVLQVVSEQNYDNTYAPKVEWATIAYQFTPEFNVRAGRTVLSFLMATDLHKVGYAIPWVRPPFEVYNLVSVSSNDGLDGSYRLSAGEAINTLQVTIGQSRTTFPSGAGGFSHSSSRELVSFVDTLEYGSTTVRINGGRSRVTIPEVGQVFDAFRAFGPEGVAIADRYDVKDSLLTFVGIGASYDPGQWFLMGEWKKVNSRSLLGAKAGWYVSAGVRVSSFTPYFVYGQARADNLSDPGLTVSSLPPFLAGAATSLNALLNATLSTKPVQNTISVGGRWDFMKNADVKLQYDRTRFGAGASGELFNLQPGYQPGGTVGVFSATIDFVF